MKPFKFLLIDWFLTKDNRKFSYNETSIHRIKKNKDIHCYKILIMINIKKQTNKQFFFQNEILHCIMQISRSNSLIHS